MTGPEHYREAEYIIEKLLDDNGAVLDVEDGCSPAWIANEFARAQVHATLALAAATALNFETGAGPSWSFVAGSPHQSGSDGA